MFSSERAPQLSNTAWKVRWSLRFAFSYVHPVTHRYRRKTVKKDFKKCLCSHRFAPPTINYCLESAAAIMFRFQLCSPRYKALESSLQSIQSPRKIRTILFYKRIPGISVPFENYTVFVMTSTGSNVITSPRKTPVFKRN